MAIPLRQAAWATLEYLAYPLIMFALAPFFVRQLGVEGYGLWMTLIAMSGFGGVAGLGMGMTATREIASIRGGGDPARVGEVLRACAVASICGCIVLAAIYCILRYTLPETVLARIGTAQQVTSLLIASTVVVLFEQLDSVFAGAIRGAERFDLSSRAEIVFKLLAVGLCAACAALTANLALFMGVVAMGAMLRMLAKALIAVRLLGPLRLRGRHEWSTVRALMGFGGWIWVQSLGSFLFASADRLLIGSLSGSSAVAVYATLTQLAQQIHAIPSAGAAVLFPVATRLRAEGASVRRAVWSVFVVVLLVAAALALAVWFLGDLLIAGWMGASFAAKGGGVLPVLALAFLLLAVCITPHYLLLAMGSARAIALLNLTAGMVAVAFSWWVLPTWGLAGAAWGKVIYAVVLIVGIAGLAWQMRGQRKLAARDAGEIG